MRRVFKYIVERTYRPLLVRYLSGTTSYTWKNISLQVPPEVFHPGFFFSTRLLLKQIEKIQLQKRTFLELGAGSGLIAMHAARSGAVVTATDINPIAISFLKKNSFRNNIKMDVIESDVFENMPRQQFDFIVINPPYYKKNPVSAKDYAWYCGENGEYFQSLFGGLGNFIHRESKVMMIVCDGCDIAMIERIAADNSFSLHCEQRHQNLLEENFIYSISR